jgi:hypothetical protein
MLDEPVISTYIMRIDLHTHSAISDGTDTPPTWWTGPVGSGSTWLR